MRSSSALQSWHDRSGMAIYLRTSCAWSLMMLVLQTLLLNSFVVLAGTGQCETKIAILDKSGDYKIHFEACSSPDPVSKCILSQGGGSVFCDQRDCDSIQGVGSITRAQFTDDTCRGTIQYPADDKSSFTVKLRRESFTKFGVLNCTLSYQYTSECPNFEFHHCPCSGQVKLELTIVIVDLELIVVGSDDVHLVENDGETFQLKDGVTDMSLECSMDSLNQPIASSLGMKQNFVFSTSKEPLSVTKEYNKSMSCDDEMDSSVQDGNWIVTRKGNTCYLMLVNFSLVDNGQYGCFLSLLNNNSPYNDDWSNSVFMVSSASLEKSFKLNNQTLGLIVTVFIAVTITLTVVIVIVFVGFVPAVHFGHKFARNNRQGLVRRPSGVSHYGSTGSIAGRNLIRPITPDPFADMHGALAQDEAEESDYLSEVETLLDDGIPCQSQLSTRTAARTKYKHTKYKVSGRSTAKSKQKVQKQESTKQSSDDELDPGITSDDQLFDLNRATEKDTPPSAHSVKNIKCQHCGREYTEGQRPYYTRHIKERRCTMNTNASAASRNNKRDSTESESGSNTSSPINYLFTMDSEKSQELDSEKSQELDSGNTLK